MTQSVSFDDDINNNDGDNDVDGADGDQGHDHHPNGIHPYDHWSLIIFSVL